MQNTESSHDLIPEDHDLQDFQKRAAAHEQAAETAAKRFSNLGSKTQAIIRAIPNKTRGLPRRYILHMIVLLILPLGLVVNNVGKPVTPQAASSTTQAATTDAPRPALGLTYTSMTHRNETLPLTEPTATEPAPTEQPVGDGPITDPEFDPGESMVIPVSQPVPNEPVTPKAAINVEKANLRGGPSTEFDTLDKLVEGANVEVLAKHEDWAHIRTEGGQEGWVSLELLNLDEETLAGLPAPSAIPTPPPAKVATITQDSLNLRDGPGTEYVSMRKLTGGAEVALLAKYNGWYQIEGADGAVGWVTSEFLDMKPGVDARIHEAESIPSANPALVGGVNTEGVNLRGGPSTKYESLGKMGAGTELQLLAQYKDWLKVQTPKGTKGWISADLVDASSFVMRRVPFTNNIPALPAPKAAPKKAVPAAGGGGGGGGGGTASGDVASMAWQFVGSRYVWGGESPSGFDCSGLTRYLYRQIGVNLPHSAAGQYSSRYGTFISGMGNLQPGDLVFFVNTAGPGITHVGIYVGDGMMVNAMTPQSGVGAVSIYSSYWSSHYYGGLRPYR